MAKGRRRRATRTAPSRGPVTWLPSRDLPENSLPAEGCPAFPVQRPSQGPPKGRLRWTCLLCRDLDPGSGTDAGPRKGCKVHGTGTFIKKVCT